MRRSLHRLLHCPDGSYLAWQHDGHNDDPCACGVICTTAELALQHHCHNCYTLEVRKLRKLHRPLFCLDGWCLVLRRHGYVCHWIKTMMLLNLHRLWPVCLVGHSVVGTYHCSTKGLPINLPMKKHCRFDRSSHLRIMGTCRCVTPGMSTLRSRYWLCGTSTAFCIVLMAGWNVVDNVADWSCRKFRVSWTSKTQNPIANTLDME